jgi:hypothetical protein
MALRGQLRADRPADTILPEAQPDTSAQLLLLSVAGLSAGAAGIHFAVIPEHLAELPVAGYFFIAVAIAQALWAILVPRYSSRALLVAGAIWTSPRWPDTVAMRPGLTVADGRAGAAVPTPAAAGSRWWNAADGGCTRRSSGRSRPALERGCGSGSGRPARP